jgi:hypothetical protein
MHPPSRQGEVPGEERPNRFDALLAVDDPQPLRPPVGQLRHDDRADRQPHQQATHQVASPGVVPHRAALVWCVQVQVIVAGVVDDWLWWVDGPGTATVLSALADTGLTVTRTDPVTVLICDRWNRMYLCREFTPGTFVLLTWRARRDVRINTPALVRLPDLSGEDPVAGRRGLPQPNLRRWMSWLIGATKPTAVWCVGSRAPGAISDVTSVEAVAAYITATFEVPTQVGRNRTGDTVTWVDGPGTDTVARRVATDLDVIYDPHGTPGTAVSVRLTDGTPVTLLRTLRSETAVLVAIAAVRAVPDTTSDTSGDGNARQEFVTGWLLRYVDEFVAHTDLPGAAGNRHPLDEVLARLVCAGENPALDTSDTARAKLLGALAALQNRSHLFELTAHLAHAGLTPAQLDVAVQLLLDGTPLDDTVHAALLLASTVVDSTVVADTVAHGDPGG